VKDAPIVGSSNDVVRYSSSMQKNISNMCKRIEEMSIVQGTRHEEGV